MSHVLAGLGPVPVTRVCWNEHDHARRQVIPLGVGRDDPVALRAHQDLIGRVEVPAIARAGFEVDLGDAKILTVLTPDSREAVHVARKDVGDASRRFPLVRFDHSHAWMVARVGQT